MTNNLKIGVVGGGAVGKAVAAFYPGTKIYDKYKPADPIEKAAAADCIFICVPTPFADGQDATEMDDAIAQTVKHLKDKANQIVIIKSTVAPGTTDAYQEKYPDVNFMFSPEFLTEKTAEGDFAYPDKQLVGYTKKTKHLAEKVLDILPDAPYQQIFPAKTCELGKYVINAYYAFKVIYANGIYDICEKLDLDYNLVRAGLTSDSRIIDTHFDVGHGGYRGYGGKCLPKDVQTLAWLGREKRTPLEFIEKIIEINGKLTAKK